MNFFGFLPTNENITFYAEFSSLFKLDIFYLSKVLFFFLRKKSILWQYSVFFVYCFMKTMKLAENHQKITFFGEKKHFFVKFHIFFFSELK